MESSSREDIPTGFKTVDSVLGGIKSPGLVLLGARPSVGKTALARTIARNLAVDRGIPVAYFTLEQSAIQLTRQFLMSEKEATSILSKSPLFIDDTFRMDMEAFRDKARTLVENNCVRVILVDFIQLLLCRRDVKREDIDPSEELKRIVMELKQTAEDLKIAILALTQLPRYIKNITDRELTLEDVMKKLDIDLDFINDHVDMIMLLNRPDHSGPGDGRKRAELNVVHNIHGGRNLTFNLRFIPEYVRFEDHE